MNCVRGSRLLEILERHNVRTLCDPRMGLPMHLNYLKRHGVAVHGGDALEWLVAVGNGVVVNDATLLRDEDVASIVEMLPGKVYALHHFSEWEGASLGEEQCQYLAIWRQNVRELRSDAQVGLAVLGLWHVLCYWLQKADAPDDMEDVAPSELAWHYVRQASQWVGSNGLHNTVRRDEPLATIDACATGALFLSRRSGERRISDPRLWMWEAWWRGNPFLALEERDEALASLLARATSFPIIVLLADERTADGARTELAKTGRAIEALSISPDEMYLIAERAGSEPR